MNTVAVELTAPGAQRVRFGISPLEEVLGAMQVLHEVRYERSDLGERLLTGLGWRRHMQRSEFMRIVHYGHACVLLETDSARILVDPGAFSEGFDAERELAAVIITHQHFDHIDIERLPGLLAANPDAKLIVDPGTEETVRKLGLEYQIAQAGDAFEVAGTAVNAVGGEHAVTHPDLPQIPNVGFLFDHGAFYHPGDSFFVPEQKVDVLGLPTGAPWLKVSEAVDFMRAVAPRIAVPIHEGVLANPAMHYGFFTNLAPAAVEVRVVPRAEAVSLG